MQIQILDNNNVYTVSRLNSEVKFLLEDTFRVVWVEGEISNFAAPNSGHWYFSLKDASAQVRCAMFRMSQRKLGFIPKDGMHVLVKARVSLYENRGEFQLILEDMEERGEGKLRRAYEALKKKLEAAGLFATTNKKSLPAFPKKIGIITSATGAAIRDILTVLKRRYPCLPIIIYPTLVQGNAAAGTIAAAIHIANNRNECDVLILARGGGSLEDLWPFNEEIVAHAIFKSKIPIISGVGHEVDFTIADFVADKRAPTPSAAAEMVTPDKAELLQNILLYKQQIERQIQRKTSSVKQQLIWSKKHLSQVHPKHRLTEKMQRLDFCELTLVQLQTRLLTKLQSIFKQFDHRLHRNMPMQKINTINHQLNLHYQRLSHLIITVLNQHQTQLTHNAAKLDTLSPLATLTRGYAIVSKNKRILFDTKDISIGDDLQVKLLKGTLDCTVTKLEQDT